MKCPKCKWQYSVRDGYAKGLQRYKCKNCNYRYTVDAAPKLSDHLRRVALILYLEGYSLRDIAKYTGVHSHNTIVHWLDNSGIKEQLTELRKPAEEMREREYLPGRKMDRWLTIAWDSTEDASVVDSKPKKYKPWGIKLGHKRLNTYKSKKKN